MIHAVVLSTALLMQAGAPAHDPSLPPSAEQAKAALDASPRHGEFVDVALPGGPALKTWVSYPERRDKAGVVIVIQEVFGLTDWLRGVADQLAKEGFIAVAPDMVSGFGPGGGGTDSVGSRDDVVALVHKITPDEVVRRLNAVYAWAKKIPAGNGKIATLGFCWGGGQSFAYAGAQQSLSAAVVFYGVSPDPPVIEVIQAPVLGHYGGDDARVDATVPAAEAQMKRLGKSFEVHTYEGAGHGFLRDQSGRDGANLKATQQAGPRTVAFLKEKLKS